MNTGFLIRGTGTALAVLLITGCLAGCSSKSDGVGRISRSGDTVTITDGSKVLTFTTSGKLDASYVAISCLVNDSDPRFRDSYAFLFAIPEADAAKLAAQYPDYRKCNSPGASQAKSMCQRLFVIAADDATQKKMDEIETRVKSDGTSPAIRLSGEILEKKGHTLDGQPVNFNSGTSTYYLVSGVEFK